LRSAAERLDPLSFSAGRTVRKKTLVYERHKRRLCFLLLPDYYGHLSCFCSRVWFTGAGEMRIPLAVGAVPRKKYLYNKKQTSEILKRTDFTLTRARVRPVAWELQLLAPRPTHFPRKAMLRAGDKNCVTRSSPNLRVVFAEICDAQLETKMKDSHSFNIKCVRSRRCFWFPT